MAGWIAPSEVALLSTLAGRNRWRRAVRQRSGKGAAKAVSEYQTAVTELAFLRARMSRGAVGPHAWEWHNERLSALAAARGRAMGQPEALTAAWLRPPPSGWAPPPPQPPGWRPDPSTAARLERRAAGWLVEPAARRGQLGPATRLSPTRPRWCDAARLSGASRSSRLPWAPQPPPSMKRTRRSVHLTHQRPVRVRSAVGVRGRVGEEWER